MARNKNKNNKNKNNKNKSKNEIEIEQAFADQFREIEAQKAFRGYGTVDSSDIDYCKIPKREWVVEEDVKTEEELIKERVEKALTGWPWIDCPQKLFLLVRMLQFLYSTRD